MYFSHFCAKSQKEGWIKKNKSVYSPCVLWATADLFAFSWCIVLYYNLHSGSQLKSNQTQTKTDFISIFQKDHLKILQII